MGRTLTTPIPAARRVSSMWRAIAACVQDALKDAGASGGDVAAVAATSMREGMVLYDQDGREIWACPNVDSRAAAEAEDLIREGAAEQALFQRLAQGRLVHQRLAGRVDEVRSRPHLGEPVK